MSQDSANGGELDQIGTEDHGGGFIKKHLKPVLLFFSFLLVAALILFYVVGSKLYAPPNGVSVKDSDTDESHQQTPFGKFVEKPTHYDEKVEFEGVGFKRTGSSGEVLFDGYQGVVSDIETDSRTLTLKSGDSFESFSVPEDIRISIEQIPQAGSRLGEFSDIEIGDIVTYSAKETSRYPMYIIVQKR